MPRSARRPVPPAAEPAPVVLEPRVWQGVVYQPCQSGASEVRQLFHFAGAFAPDLEPGEIAWEARADGRLVGGRALRAARRARVHPRPGGRGSSDRAPSRSRSPRSSSRPSSTRRAPFRSTPLFTRPQGLDRVWVRLGFVPMPQAFLPETLRGRPGSGLHVWRRPGTYAVPVADPEAEGRRRGRR